MERGIKSKEAGAGANRKLEDGNARALRMVERALEEGGVESTCLGTVRALPVTEEVVGAGSVAVAIVPESAYRRDIAD